MRLDEITVSKKKAIAVKKTATKKSAVKSAPPQTSSSLPQKRVPAKEVAETIYGRLLESVHVMGYCTSRASGVLKWLLKDNHWKQVGGGFDDVYRFMASLGATKVKDAIERAEIAKLLAEIGASQRATAKFLGVAQRTVQSDLGKPRKRGDAKASSAPAGIQKQADNDGKKLSGDAKASDDVPPGWVQAEVDPAKRAESRDHKQQAHAVAEALARQSQPDTSVILIHGDMVTVLPTLGRFDLIIADPPYNVTEWEWDRRGPNFLAEAKRWLTVCRAALAEQYQLFWFCSPQYAADMEMIFRELGLPIQSRIVWHRRNMALGSDAKQRFIDTWEMVLHSGNAPLNFPPEWDESRFDVQIFPVPQSNFDDMKVHPTQKPLGLIQRLVQFGSVDGARVLDPFAGGGTTGAAAAGRQCTLIEREEAFVCVIEQRLGKTRTELASTGGPLRG